MPGHTLRDVATRAGVSKATASRVLNGSAAGRPRDTRAGPRRDGRARLHTERHGAAAELRAHPHDQRRHVVPDPAPGRGTPSWRGRRARRQRVRPGHLQRRDDRQAGPVPARPRARAQRTDGLLVISLPLRDEDVERLSSAAIPVVVVDAHAPAVEGLPHVVGDDIAGGELATGHLLQLGHRRIAYLGDEFDNPFGFTSSRHRFTGYERALAAAGLEARTDHVVLGAHSRYEARELAARLLSRPRPADRHLRRQRHAGPRRHQRRPRGRPARPRRPVGRGLRRHRDRRLPGAHDRAPGAVRVRPHRRRAAARGDPRALGDAAPPSSSRPRSWSAGPRRHAKEG